MIYSDACVPLLGDAKHPAMLGESSREVWSETWPVIGPPRGKVHTGRATSVEDLQMFFARRPPAEEVYVTFCCSPVFADGHTIEATSCACTEIAGKVVGERWLSTLRHLGLRAFPQPMGKEACRDAAAVLLASPLDVPFAAIYLVDDDSRAARRVATTRLPEKPSAFPLTRPLSPDSGQQPSPLADVTRTGAAAEVSELPARIGAFPTPLWPDLVGTALILPLASSESALVRFLIVGINPRCILDAGYRTFLDRAAEHIATAIAGARAFEGEWRRAEAPAEISRERTIFLVDINRELRTPLTLMLSPLLKLAAKPKDELSDLRLPATTTDRNSLRLLRLANALLDFSCIEDSRANGSYEPIDLAGFTTELASNFNSGCGRAGLRLDVICATLPEPIYVDRDMWKKIVLNVLSNAFKFTFEGSLSVSSEGRKAAPS